MKKRESDPAERARQILAQSIDKKLVESGMTARDQLAIATALLGLIARRLRASA